MRRAGWWVSALALCWVGLLQEAPAARVDTALSQLLQRLDLGSAEEGTMRWLEKLGAFSSGPARERLLAVTSDGVVVHSLDGEAAHVRMTVELDEDLRREGSRLVLLHNHPNSTGLSGDDLLQLEKRGVTAVVAIGHDGSVYAAARGPRFDAQVCGGERYADVREDIRKTLEREADASEVGRLLSESFLTHVTALALFKARYLEYTASLAPNRRASFDRDRLVFGRVVASVGARLGERRH